VYLYRALDSAGNTVDFLLRKHRYDVAAKAFFRKAFKQNGYPQKVVIDKSDSDLTALNSANKELPQDQ
jgi:putative transposase